MLSRRDLRVIGGIGTLLWGSQFSGAIDVTVSDNSTFISVKNPQRSYDASVSVFGAMTDEV